MTVQYDHLQTLPDGSLIQHGPSNDRVYLLKAGSSQPAELARTLICKAEACGYTKVFAKVPMIYSEAFTDAGYAVEAVVPDLYDGSMSGVFLGYFLNTERKIEKKAELYDSNILLSENKKITQPAPLDTERFQLRRCTLEDSEEMAALYQEVFPTYPFPVHDPEYISETMQDNSAYFCIQADQRIIALSSAEFDSSDSNAEMTDFATLPEWTGNNFAVHLLSKMENTMKQQGIKTAYTIARAASPGMNITFSRQGYSLAGRLKNNTNISGEIQSMNIWFKPLA